MRHNKLIQAICLFAGSLAMVACAQSEDLDSTPTNEVLEIRVVDSQFQSNSTSRANTDVQYMTTFDEGDKIGLFAVANNEAFIENTKATYTNGEWVIDKGSLPCSEDMATVTFYAYYTYRENMTFTPADTDPFAVAVREWTIENDLSGNNYTKNDLMTGAASAIGNTVTFMMKHRMALVVAELPSITYNFTNTDVELAPYSVQLQDVKFAVGDREYTPYYDQATVTYRLLVNSTENVEVISGSFTSPKDNKLKEYSIDATKLAEGVYTYCEVDGGPQTVEHVLKVGDLIYSNGALASVDNETAVSKDCVGVVYFVGNPMPSVKYPWDENKPKYTFKEGQDVLLREHPSCTHGLALGLKECKDVKFAATKRGLSLYKWYGESFSEAEDYIMASPLYWREEQSKYDVDNNHRNLILGYNHTEVIKKYAAQEGKLLSIFDVLDSYSLVAPVISSGWYIPSVGDLMEALITRRAVVVSQLDKVNGDPLTERCYWSSTERHETAMYTVRDATGNISAKDDNAANIDARFSFAF